ncbi:glycosyltransferase [Paraglaciecola sp.]|uniref:glycosyltransferase n=1 Tax=Paraglaciecola sp. TaxID=1920173 RepID=UPI0030F3BFF1
MKAKILTLATRHSTGGAQMNTYLVASKLAERGYNSQACYLFKHGEMEIDSSVPCNIFCMNKASALNVIPSIFRFLVFCIKFKPEVIIGFHPLANIVAVIYKFFNKDVSVLATQRNPAISMSGFTRRIEKFFGSHFYASNICVSNAVKASFSEYPQAYQNKFIVIHNGIDGFDTALESKVFSRSFFSLDTNDFLIGFIGRIHHQKNPLFLVDVAESLRNKNSDQKVNFVFVVAGEGDLESEFRELIKNKNLDEYFNFVGNLSGDLVPHFFNAIDTFILPSLYEGFGRTIVENMFFGNPMILNDLEVTREVAGDLGYFTKLDPDYCVDTILALYDKSCTGDLVLESEKIKARANSFSVSKMIDGYQNQIINVSKQCSED